MGFNADAYRKEAKALGLSDEQIESDIAEETAGHTGSFSDPTADSVDLNKDNIIPGWLQPALGVSAAGAAGAVGKGIYDRMIGGKKPEQQAPARIEPQMDVNQKPQTGRIEPTWEPQQVIQEANQGIQTEPITREQAAARLANAPEHPNPVTHLKQSDVNMLGASEAAKIEKSLPPPVQTQAGVAPTQPVQAAPAKTEKVPAKPKEQHTFATAAEATAKNPEMVFIPKAGGADNWMEKQFGPETRKHIRDLFNSGEHYGGGQAAMDKAYADVKRYGQWLKENVPVQTLDRDERKALGVPPLKEYPTLGRAVKIAGAAGILATAAQAANAAQQARKGDYSSGNELIFNLLGSIPGLGTAFNAATYTKGLGEGEEKELAKRRGMAPTIR